jgi:hypothetical protein
VKRFEKYRRELWNDMENMEQNCEKICKIRKKNNFNSEII